MFFMGSMGLLVACGNNAKRELNKKLVELVAQDHTVDAKDWQVIVQQVNQSKDALGDFFTNGKLDENALKSYIADFFQHRRPSVDVRFVGLSGQSLSFHIYVEKSASMQAYDSPQGDGAYHSTIMALQNITPTGTQVDSIGEKGYTDFRAIFDRVLNKTRPGEVSILVSDLIYSVREMEGVNPQKVFSEMQEMIHSVFKDEVKRKSILVVRLMGSYVGPYYSFDNSVHSVHSQRPYYVVVVADNDAMNQLTTDPNFRSFAQLSQWKGYDNQWLMSTNSTYHPYYSLLLNHPNIRGRFRPERGQDSQITRLERVEAERNGDKIQLAVAVDLSQMFVDARYLMDKRNYQIMSDDPIVLQDIIPLKRGELGGAERKYAGSATHLMLLSMDKVTRAQDIHIQLLNQQPMWVANGSTDKDLQPDATTTFGLRYLLGGIFDSYRRNAEAHLTYFDLTLHIDK